ncbi:MAG: glycosyltransferase family 39 protein [Candidatus Eisenbacteria bacterium]|nr:glycosyltransferase family 39 protein [Candidatus Eisenbacteria bacterium]
MHLISLLVTSAVIFLSFLPYCARIFPLWSERIMSSAALATIDVIVVETILGISGNLTRPLTVGGSVLLSLVFLSFSLLRIRKQPPPPPRSAKKNGGFAPGLVLCFVSLGFAYLLILLLAAITPPYSWDSLTYHLTAVFAWISERRLMVPHFPGAPMWYPMNGELLTLWTFVAGGAKAVNFSQLPFSFLGGLACYSISRKFSAGSYSFYSFILFSATPVIMIQSLTQYNDVVYACFFLLSLAFLVGFLKAGARQYLFFSAISFGLFLGTKATALYSWIPLALILIAGVAGRKELARVFIRTLPFLLIIVIICGGFFYLRNLVLTGNIVFPVTVKFLGKTVMPGLVENISGELQESWFVKRSFDWILYPLFETFHGKRVYGVENGFGIQFLLGLISLPFALFVSLKKKDIVLSTLFVTAIPVAVLVWLTIHPYREPRYLISLCGISAISIVYLASAMTGWAGKVVTVLMVFATLASTLLTLPQLVPRQTEVLSQLTRSGVLAVYDYYKAEYGDLGEGWKWIDEHTKDGDLIAVTYSELTSPLFGESGMRRVKYFPTERTAFPNLESSTSPDRWPALLFEKGVKYLFLWEPSFSGGSRMERTIADKNPSVLRKEISWEKTAFGDLTIFSVGKPEPPESRTEEIHTVGTEGIWYPVPTEHGTISINREPLPETCEVRYRFARQTPGDYVEMERMLTETDMSPFKTLSFEIDRGDSRDLLQVYLKGSDPRQQQRHNINLFQLGPAWNEVSLDLRQPSFETKKFALENVRSLSFVFVQSTVTGPQERRIRIKNLHFR